MLRFLELDMTGKMIGVPCSWVSYDGPWSSFGQGQGHPIAHNPGPVDRVPTGHGLRHRAPVRPQTGHSMIYVQWYELEQASGSHAPAWEQVPTLQRREAGQSDIAIGWPRPQTPAIGKSIACFKFVTAARIIERLTACHLSISHHSCLEPRGAVLTA